MRFEQLCMGCMTHKGEERVCPHCHWKETSLPASPYHLPPRTIVNHRYLIGRVIQQGKFGITYLAFDTGSRRRCVVKEFLPKDIITRFPGNPNIIINDIESQPDFSYCLSKFSEETAVLQKIRPQPGLAHTFDFFRENSTAYRVNEYVDAITLSDYLIENGGKASFHQMITMLTPVMSGLEKMHARGLLHFDIYPDNLLVNTDGTAKLINFSGSNFVIARRWKILRSILRPGYSPQELFYNIRISGPWSDIYALAATMYFALTGYPVPDAINRVKRDTLVPPSQYNPNVSPEVEKHLLRALAVHPAARFQSMRAFKEALLKTWYEKERRSEDAAIDPFKQIVCPFCSTSNEVLTTDLLAGTSSCFACHRPLTIADLESGPVLPKPKSSKLPPAQTAPKAFKVRRTPPLDVNAFTVITCQACEARNEVLVSDLGTMATCIVCGSRLDNAFESPPFPEASSAAESPPPAPEAPVEKSHRRRPSKKSPPARPVIPRLDQPEAEPSYGEPETPAPETLASAPAENRPAQPRVSDASGTPETAERAPQTAPEPETPHAPPAQEAQVSDSAAPEKAEAAPPETETLDDISIPDRLFDLLQESAREKRNKASRAAESDEEAGPAQPPESPSPEPPGPPPRQTQDNDTEQLANSPDQKTSPSTEQERHDPADTNGRHSPDAPLAADRPIAEAPPEKLEPPPSPRRRKRKKAPPAADDSGQVTYLDCPKCHHRNQFLLEDVLRGVNCVNCGHAFISSPMVDGKAAPADITPADVMRRSRLSVPVMAALAAVILLLAGTGGYYYVQHSRTVALETQHSRFVQIGERFFQTGDYPEALANFQAALALMPEDETLQAKIRECQDLLLEAEQQKAAEDLYQMTALDRADSLFEAGNFSAARDAYQALLQNMPGDSYISERLAETDGRLAAPPAAQPKKPAATPIAQKLVAHSNDDIQALIDQAAPNSTIQFAEGIYKLTQPLTIRKPLRMLGAGPNHTLIISDLPEAMIRVSKGVKFSAAGIGFEYEGREWADVLVVNDATVQFSRCAFKGAVYDPGARQGGSGIVFNGSSGGVVSESFFSGNQFAVYSKDNSKPVIQNSELRSNHTGIRISGEARPTVKQNHIYDNSSNGIAIFDAAQPKVLENRIRLNRANGLYFSANDFSGTIIKNEILDNKDLGVLLADQSRPTLEENIIRGNGLGGLQYKDQSRGILRNNQIQGNKYGGIKIINAAAPTLTKNTIRNNQGDGIEILDKAHPTVNGNEIVQNSGDGISLLLLEPGGLLTNNTCTGNRGYGISILKPAQPSMVNNTIHGNNEGSIYQEDISQN